MQLKYLSQEDLLEYRNLINTTTTNKLDTFVGIILLILSSNKIGDYYYRANMSQFSNFANSAFTLKDVPLKTSEKIWYALFTPTWAERSLKYFLFGRKININILLATIFWYKDSNFVTNKTKELKNLISEKDFNILFDNQDINFNSNYPIKQNILLKLLKNNNENSSTNNSFTIKYDGSFIQKDAGDLNASVYGQTLYSGLEIKKIINVFEFDIIAEFKFNNHIFTDHCDDIFPNLATKNREQFIKAQNILFYGMAGVGKSYHINNITNKDENCVERIVFHPDYLNTDFIGQILPTVNANGIIDYQFKAGSFTKILKKAINDPNNHYYLVIEEINRGNAPAIFGEIFQLLDRNENGESSYKISHNLIAKEIYSDGDRMIYIPHNLSILATMNSADQNVFTLDTAFQRRWTMRMIENNIASCPYKNDKILDTNITWQVFNTVINDYILEVNKDTLSSEDKRLGAFFVSKDELALPKNTDDGIVFGEKVIKYLWDDVFKFNKSKLFKDEFNSLDKVLNEFKKNKNFKRFDIFNETIQNKLTTQLSDNIN